MPNSEVPWHLLAHVRKHKLDPWSHMHFLVQYSKYSSHGEALLALKNPVTLQGLEASSAMAAGAATARMLEGSSPASQHIHRQGCEGFSSAANGTSQCSSHRLGSILFRMCVRSWGHRRAKFRDFVHPLTESMLVAPLASLLFDPPEPQIIGKTRCFATFLPFRTPASSFF